LAQALLRVDLSHHVFDVVRLHGLMNHHVPEDLRDDVVSLDLMVCVQGGRDGRLSLSSIVTVSFTLFNYLYSND
jgi:hypothetical protein